MTANEYLALTRAAAKAGEVLGARPDRVIVRASAGIIRNLQSVVQDTEYMDEGNEFDVIVILYAGDSYVKVRITDHDTNVVWVEKDGEVLEAADRPAETSQ